MKIKTTYMNGDYEEADSESSLGSSNLFQSGTVGVVNTILKSSDLSHGLWMKQKYYDVGQASQIPGHESLVANTMLGAEYLILSENDLESVALIEVDNRKIAWRQGFDGPLVNGFKFQAQADMFLFSQGDMPLNQQAVELYKIFHGEGCAPMMPQLHSESDREWDQRIAETIGWDVDELLKFVEIDRINMMMAEEEDGPSIEEGIDFGTGELLGDLPPEEEEEEDDGDGPGILGDILEYTDEP